MAFERTSDFSFRGVHISNFGVHYVPERKDWHIWEHNYKTSESSGDGHDGAQWDGNTVEPKEFVLRLYYEEIPERWLSAAISLFERTGSGELIFDERPWLVYIARPFKAVVVEKYPHGDGVFNGFITVSLKAYYPFALSSFNTLDDNVEYPHLHERLMATSALLPANRMPVNATGTKTAQFTYNAYNGGTARADTIIKIAGNVGAGIDIYNMLTKQWCRVIGLTQANSTNLGKWLEMDSRTGECYLTDGVNKTNGYQYHDRGFIQLHHGMPIQRGVQIEYNTNTLTASMDTFLPDDVGKVMNLNGTWSEVLSVLNPKKVVVAPALVGTGYLVTDLVNMNRLVVTPLTTMSITKFEVEHKHTFE